LDTIKHIDVIWFQDEFPVCCFEIEHTTGVTQEKGGQRPFFV